MASEKITKILLAKSPLTPDEIKAMSDREAWGWLYSHFPPKFKRKAAQKNGGPEICFTGFSASDRTRLEAEAQEAHLDVVKSVTTELRYLVAGPNAGPSKLQKAKAMSIAVMSAEQFHAMLETGELPD